MRVPTGQREVSTLGPRDLFPTYLRTPIEGGWSRNPYDAPGTPIPPDDRKSCTESIVRPSGGRVVRQPGPVYVVA